MLRVAREVTPAELRPALLKPAVAWLHMYVIPAGHRDGRGAGAFKSGTQSEKNFFTYSERVP